MYNDTSSRIDDTRYRARYRGIEVSIVWREVSAMMSGRRVRARARARVG